MTGSPPDAPGSAQERQDEERVAAPAGRRLHLAAARHPPLGLLVVPALDGQRGEALVAREEELRLADLLGDGEGAPVVVRAPLLVAPALVDLGEDDERDRQVAPLA